jgi:hypothetical protein
VNFYFIKFQHKFFTCFILLLCCFLFSRQQASAQAIFKVTGNIQFNPRLKVYPERREVLPTNWQNESVVEIRAIGSRNPILASYVTTDPTGNGSMVPIDVSSLPPGYYDISVKGYSQLRKVFSGKPFFLIEHFYDLTTDGEFLKSGDTIDDNYVNLLDLKQTEAKLYTDDLKNDLNRDGIVNSLDVSNLVYNFNVNGEE